MWWAAALVLAAGCGNDDCERLCNQTGIQLGRCIPGWPAEDGWEQLDATNRADFQRRCRNRWGKERADLEPRELDDALDQCQESIDVLNELRNDGTACDAMRALYFE